MPLTEDEAGPATVTGYLSDLARAGAKVGTMSRRPSAIKFAHQLRNLDDPTRNARVLAVCEGIRRTHGAPPQQAAPLMPSELFDILAACPTTKTWRTKGRPTEPDLAGARDRALLLVVADPQLPERDEMVGAPDRPYVLGRVDPRIGQVLGQVLGSVDLVGVVNLDEQVGQRRSLLHRVCAQRRPDVVHRGLFWS